MIQGMRRFLFVSVLALAGWTPWRTTDDNVERGNAAMAAGNWDAAIQAYQAAKGSGVDEQGLDYDLGTAELRKAEASKDDKLRAQAMDDLASAAKSKDPSISSRASYNRGNTQMEDGKLDDAIESYKDALRADPDMDDAKLNLELALRKRQKQEQQQQQQQQQQGQGQGQGQQQQQQQGQGQGQQQQQQQGQGQGQQQQNQQGQGQQQQNQQGQGQGSDQQQNQQGQGQGSDQQQNQQQGQGQGQQQNQQQGQGQQGQDQQQQGQGQDSQTPFDPSSRQHGPQQSPKTPDGEKLQQLDDAARTLRRDQLKGKARDTTRMPTGQDW